MPLTKLGDCGMLQPTSILLQLVLSRLGGCVQDVYQVGSYGSAAF